MQLKDASILLVDDEPLLLDIFGCWLKPVAGQVFCAGDGAQALQLLAKQRIDLIVSDVRMPVMNGISLLRSINKSGLHTPLVIFTSGFSDMEVREAYDLGAVALLEKPFQRADLINAVKQSLLERNERWQTQLDHRPDPVLKRSFASLREALQQRQIAFGRGGFCLETSQFMADGPVNIELDFKDDRYVLRGQGIIRWLAHYEHQAGIEFTYVDEPSRGRVVQLTEESRSFIPRSTGRAITSAGSS
jgi:CheY-like chemotaxis protein